MNFLTEIEDSDGIVHEILFDEAEAVVDDLIKELSAC